MLSCPVCSREFESLINLKCHWGRKCKKICGNEIAYFYLTDQYTDFSKLSKGARRHFLLRESNYKCSQCNFSKTRENGASILEIDHIDGNHENNSRENLRVLCPNCHALTPNFRNWGRKSGEKSSTRFRKGNKGFQTLAEEKKFLKESLVEENKKYEELFVETVTRTSADGTINYRKFGWVVALMNELHKNKDFDSNIFCRKTIGEKMKKIMPDFYEKNCYKVYRKTVE